MKFEYCKQFIALILLLYLIPIVDIIFNFCFLAKDFTYQSWLLFFLNVTSLLAGTTASVAASLLFYKNHKDVEKIETNRIIIVVLSLSIHLIVELLLIKEDFNIIARYFITIILLVITLVLVWFVIRYYKSIDNHRKGMDKIAFESLMSKKEMNDIKNTNKANVDGDNYNVEG